MSPREQASMDDLAGHWNPIFAGTPERELGWYEADVRQTLALLALIPGGPQGTALLPGAGTSRLVEELAGRGLRLVVNDVSDEALLRLQARLGAAGHDTIWLRGDIAAPLPAGTPPVDLWVDRAVLHFLLREPEIAGYFDNLRAVLKPGGHVLLAEFAAHGAPRCAGRDVHRYTVAEMMRRLGPGFSLVQAEDYVFVNPAGGPRPYVYALFRRAL